MRCVSQGGWEEKSPSCGIVCPYSPQQLVISDTPISKLDQTTNKWSSSILIVWLPCEYYAKVYLWNILFAMLCPSFSFLEGSSTKSTFTRYTACSSAHFFHFEKMDFVNKISWGICKAILLVPPLFRAITKKTPWIIDCINDSTFWNEKQVVGKMLWAWVLDSW